MIYEIENLPTLSAAQYDAAKARAADRVQKSLGDRPTRKAFKREYAPLITSLDWLAVIIFIAAFCISSIHILAYSGHEAAASYQAVTGVDLLGVNVDSHTYGVIHQIGFILLAESAMLLFFVLFRTRSGFERWLAFTLALLAMVFVIVANLASGLNLFLAVLAPSFTIGVGFRLETLAAENLRRNQEIDSRYLEALTVWEAAQEDVTRHPDYTPALARELWDKLTSLKAGQPFADAPNSFKVQAVQRELARDSWAYGMDSQPVMTIGLSKSNGHRSDTENPTQAPALVTANGNGAH